MAEQRFEDRRAAGRALVGPLRELSIQDPIVLALPRGGVPVAFEVACALCAPLDVFGAGKLGAPANPEFAIGAAAEDGTTVIDEQSVLLVGLTTKQAGKKVVNLVKDVAERTDRARGGRPMIGIESRSVVLVDDGLGTGLTCLAALRGIRGLRPARLVLAVPVAAAPSLADVAPEADDVVCPLMPSQLVSVGSWYEDFAPVSDETVSGLLADARAFS